MLFMYQNVSNIKFKCLHLNCLLRKLSNLLRKKRVSLLLQGLPWRPSRAPLKLGGLSVGAHISHCKKGDRMLSLVIMLHVKINQSNQVGLSFRRDLHRLKAFLLSHWKSLDQLLIILKLEKSPNNHSFKIARTLSIDTSLFEMECILKNMKNKSHLSEIIYESYLHTIFLTTLIFLLTIGYARKHLVHHCSYNSKAGICIS